MKLSLVLATAGLVAASAACTSRDRTEVERTTSTTITSAPMDPPQDVVTAPVPAPQPTTTPAAPVPRDITPPVTPSTATARPDVTATPTAAETTRASQTSDLVERGQLVGPSLAPSQAPIVIFSNGPGASGSTDFVQPSAASTETPSDFSPRLRSVAPTSTAGQGQIDFNVPPSGRAF